jgi:hypothetical protein
MAITRFVAKHYDAAITSLHKNMEYQTAETCQQAFGFTPNARYSVLVNAANIIGLQYPSQYFSRPSNMTFHNMCSPNVTLPHATANLLGNGLKFCIKTPRPHQELKTAIQRFQRSFRLHFQFNEPSSDTESAHDDDDLYNQKYIPLLYIPSIWDPPIQKDHVENDFSKFDGLLNAVEIQYLAPLSSAIHCGRETTKWALYLPNRLPNQRAIW